MGKLLHGIGWFLRQMNWAYRLFLPILLIVLLLVLLFAGDRIGLKFCRSWQEAEPLAAVKHETEIAETPDEIKAVRQIGQWEFLSVQTEELVERHESRLLGEKHLVRIYYGTVRLGMDTADFSDDWFAAKGDTAVLTLPPIEILNEDFIDEARTLTFYEEGTFDATTKQAMYAEAAAAMKARALSAHNLKQAKAAAHRHFKALFQAFGFKAVEFKLTR